MTNIIHQRPCQQHITWVMLTILWFPLFAFTTFRTIYQKNSSSNSTIKSLSEYFFSASRFAILHTEVDRFDNSGSNSLIDFINKHFFFFIFVATPPMSLRCFFQLYRQGEFPYSSQSESNNEQHRTPNSRVKFHTIILITSRYSSGRHATGSWSLMLAKNHFDQ